MRADDTRAHVMRRSITRHVARYERICVRRARSKIEMSARRATERAFDDMFCAPRRTISIEIINGVRRARQYAARSVTRARARVVIDNNVVMPTHAPLCCC